MGKPSEILTKLNEMAGFSPNEEIELYEVLHNPVFISLEYTKHSNLLHAFSTMCSLCLYSSFKPSGSSRAPCSIVNAMHLFALPKNILGFNILLLQEIKFEPNVMCEHIDKKLTFRASQVCKIFFLWI